MKANIFAISLIFILASSAAMAGQLDPRFEGVWAGKETYMVYASATQTAASEPVRMDALIAIADGGQTFGVVQGLGPGKYKASSESKGKKLVFRAHFSGTGRTTCIFELSEDGNTIKETGYGLLPGLGNKAVECTIEGTLHRRSKK